MRWRGLDATSMYRRAKELQAGDIVKFGAQPDRKIAEVKPDVVASANPPHRRYKVMRVRWEGEDDFTWKTGVSQWISFDRPEV